MPTDFLERVAEVEVRKHAHRIICHILPRMASPPGVRASDNNLLETGRLGILAFVGVLPST